MSKICFQLQNKNDVDHSKIVIILVQWWVEGSEHGVGENLRLFLTGTRAFMLGELNSASQICHIDLHPKNWNLRVVKSKRTLHGCFAWEIPSICQNMPIMNSFSDKDSRILLMSLWVWQESWFLSMQYAKLFNKAVLDKIKVSRYYQKVALRSFSTFQ